ncbi:MAG: FimB/Mfa2 family fimbrial subunit [Bacteroides sp.]|nr:FimB/Mfa2 family fimbrial subunit [Bacteroides sp.]
MNLRYTPFPGIILLLIALLYSCIKGDSNSSCVEPVVPGDQGVHVYLYSRTPCQTDSLYPEEIRDVLLAVFDQEGKLVTYTRDTIPELNDLYFEEIRTKPGLYTVIAWSGVDDTWFDMQDIRTGSKKDDLLFRIRREGDLARSIADHKVFYGESIAFYVEDNKETEAHFENVHISMQEVTNRISVSVEGLPNTDQFEVIIQANNGSVNMNGTPAADETLIYQGDETVENFVLEAHFTLLSLHSGYENTLIIRDKESGTEIFSGNLLGTLLLKNPEVNLACDHDFTIEFTAEDQCNCGTYVIMAIRVNKWLVHSYDTEISR